MSKEQLFPEFNSMTILIVWKLYNTLVFKIHKYYQVKITKTHSLTKHEMDLDRIY